MVNPSARRVFRDEIGSAEIPMAHSTFLVGESNRSRRWWPGT